MEPSYPDKPESDQTKKLTSLDKKIKAPCITQSKG